MTLAVQFSTSGGGVLTYTGYTGGTVNAALNITQSITTPSLLLNPLFNATTGGSTFTVEVFNGSTSQGSQTGASGGAQARIQLPAGFTRPLIIEPVWNQLVSGQCQFTAILPSATTMTLPNGTSLTGDRVVFTEEINPGGHYPYTGATSMDVQSNVSSYVITAESIIPH